MTDRFWTKVDKASGHGPYGHCWVWTAYRLPTGYGRFRFEGRMVVAHRHAYESLVEPVPEGLELDHLCRNPACVNPAHLEPVAHAENVRRSEWRPTFERMREAAYAARRAKTHCRKGHPLSGDNLYLAARGSRHCKVCRHDAVRRYRRTN